MNHPKILLALTLAALLAGCDSSTSSEDPESTSSSSSQTEDVSSSSSKTGMTSSSSKPQQSSSSLAQYLEAEGNPTLDYKLERNAKVNRQGVGIDFVHAASTLDTAFLSDTRAFESDLIFYNVMVYYKGTTGDSVSEGCPAILMYTAKTGSVAATPVGKGTDFFTSYTRISPAEISALQSDPVVDFAALHYDSESIHRDTLMNVYSTLTIGNKFRATVLEIPEGSTEQAEQPVFLVRTREGAYAKFMVTQFQGAGADKQKTLVRWQVMVSAP